MADSLPIDFLSPSSSPFCRANQNAAFACARICSYINILCAHFEYDCANHVKIMYK